MDKNKFWKIREIILLSYDEDCIVEDIQRELDINNIKASELLKEYKKADKERNENWQKKVSELIKNVTFCDEVTRDSNDSSTIGEKCKTIIIYPFKKMYSAYQLIKNASSVFYMRCLRPFYENKYLMIGYLLIILGTVYIFMFDKISVNDKQFISYQHFSAVALGFIMVAEISLLSEKRKVENKKTQNEYLDLLGLTKTLLRKDLDKKKMHYNVNAMIKNTKDMGLTNPAHSDIELYEKIKRAEENYIKIGLVITTFIWGCGEFF